MMATLGFTFTNISLAQEEPLRFVGLDNYQTLLGDAPGLGVARGSPFKFAAALAAGHHHRAVPARARCSTALPQGPGAVPGPVLPALRRAVRGRASSSGRGCSTSRPAGSTGSCASSASPNPPDWLNDPTCIYPALVFIGIWGIGAGIIINLAGLRGIPTELYDAARIDGAGWWATLRHVTLPMMSPVIFYTLILGVVEVLQYFLVPLVIKNGTGEPGGTTLFFNLYLYKTFFTFQNMSYGATLAWLLFVDHARSSRCSCSGSRDAGSTTPASGRRGRRPRRSRTRRAPSAVARARGSGGRRPRRPRDASAPSC